VSFECGPYHFTTQAAAAFDAADGKIAAGNFFFTSALTPTKIESP
jgi:hypothetical protein